MFYPRHGTALMWDVRVGKPAEPACKSSYMYISEKHINQLFGVLMKA